MFELARRQVERAADHLQLDDATRRRFEAPARVVEVTVPDPRPGGDVITALRVQHSTDRGPAKGGVRMADSVDRNEVEALALLMTLKTATASLPLGGGKAGIIADPGSFGDDQRATLLADLARAWAPVIGPGLDVLGPDVGTGPAEMAALHRAWQDATGADGSPATGKPVDDGGLELRTGATARGLEIVLDALLDQLDLGDTIRFAIHGFGSVGRGLAERLVGRGHQLVAIGDSGGAAIDLEGLDLDQIGKRKDGEGSVSDGEHTSGDVLTVDCDLLVPAALQGAIDSQVAPEVQASVVLEGANGPCTAEGADILVSRGVMVVPDILANSGGVAASYEEMTPPGEREANDQIADRLDDRLSKAATEVWSMAERESLDLRTAATVLAMQRVIG